jgi:squalene-hopene/tetraprenyl-beta-curcumene cyclase
MAYSALMFLTLGYPRPDPRIVQILNAIDKLLIVGDHEAYCQPCVSPVWDTGLACHALMEAGGKETVPRISAALKPIQVTDIAGDWAVQRPYVRPGGWAFQYANDYYPDLDDTAIVAMALDRAKGRTPLTRDRLRAREWSEGLQSANGGWAAFDTDNDREYLNYIPFADHGALLDPPTEDVTARGLSMLGRLGETPASCAAVTRGLSPSSSAGRRQLVWLLGNELYLRYLVGALRFQRGQTRSAK